MQTKPFQIKEILEFQPKSRHKAGEGLDVGEFPFFTSSQNQRKWFTIAEYMTDAVILGTGGMPSVHFSAEFSTSTDVFILAPKSKNISAKYISYYLTANKGLLEKGFKGAGLKHLSKDYVEKLTIRLPVDKNGNPDSQEQDRIVKILEEAELIKEKREEANRKMETLVPALFDEMFGGLKLLSPLSELVSLVSGGTPSTQKESFWNGNIPWVSAKDMKIDFVDRAEDYITESAVKETNLKYIEPGSILIVVRGMILARYIPINVTEKRLTINQDLKALVPKGENNGVYLWAALRSMSGQIFNATQTAAHGTKKLNTSDLLSLKIPLPSVALQNKFAETVREIEEQKEKQRMATKKTDELFASLLGKYFPSSM